jgi:DNA-binding transcriptional LysR family regulator
MSTPIYDSYADAVAALRRLTMTELRRLSAIKTGGNFSRAALAASVSQPALSQQARDMETKLGVPLFLRGNGGMVPTPFGDVLARKSRLSMEALLDRSWIVPAEDTTFYKQIAESLRRAEVAQPITRIASYSMLALAAVVTTSKLLGFLPMSLYASGTMSNSVRRLPVDLVWTPAPLGIVMWRDAGVTERARRLLEILRAVAGSARASAHLRDPLALQR